MLQRHSLHGFSLVILNQTSQPAIPLMALDTTRPARLGASASFLCRDAVMFLTFRFSRSESGTVPPLPVQRSTTAVKRLLVFLTGGGIHSERAGATAREEMDNRGRGACEGG